MYVYIYIYVCVCGVCVCVCLCSSVVLFAAGQVQMLQQAQFLDCVVVCHHDFAAGLHAATRAVTCRHQDQPQASTNYQDLPREVE